MDLSSVASPSDELDIDITGTRVSAVFRDELIVLFGLVGGKGRIPDIEPGQVFSRCDITIVCKSEVAAVAYEKRLIGWRDATVRLNWWGTPGKMSVLHASKTMWVPIPRDPEDVNPVGWTP